MGRRGSGYAINVQKHLAGGLGNKRNLRFCLKMVNQTLEKCVSKIVLWSADPKVVPISIDVLNYGFPLGGRWIISTSVQDDILFVPIKHITTIADVMLNKIKWGCYNYKNQHWKLDHRDYGIEDLLFQRVTWAIEYCKEIKVRIPEVEAMVIKSGPHRMVHWARIWGRWPEVEPTIMKYPSCAVQYLNIIGKTIEEIGYDVIKTFPLNGSLRYPMKYASGSRQRWQQLEDEIVKRKDPELALKYHGRLIGTDRWLEAEEILKTNDEIWKRYCHRVKYVD